MQSGYFGDPGDPWLSGCRGRVRRERRKGGEKKRFEKISTCGPQNAVHDGSYIFFQAAVTDLQRPFVTRATKGEEWSYQRRGHWPSFHPLVIVAPMVRPPPRHSNADTEALHHLYHPPSPPGNKPAAGPWGRPGAPSAWHPRKGW